MVYSFPFISTKLSTKSRKSWFDLKSLIDFRAKCPVDTRSLKSGDFSKIDCKINLINTLYFYFVVGKNVRV